MSRNRYIYISSLDAPNHSDFIVNFPEQLMIKPYSQIRCVVCRINPSDNLIEIDDTNRLFYVGVDHWNKKNSVIPLLPIKIAKGVYNLEDGDNDFLNLNAEIEDKLATQLKPYCYLRGDSSCEFTTAQKLKINVSGMQLYGCPTIALDNANAPADILQYWGNFQNYVVDIANDVECHPIQNISAVAMDDNLSYGIKITKNLEYAQYYLSPPIVTGLTGANDGDRHMSHYYELDFEDIDQVNELGTFPDSNHYHRFYFGGLKQEDLGYKWGEVGKWHKNQKAELDPRIVYAIEFNNSNCVLSYNGLEDEKVQTFNISKYRGSVSSDSPVAYTLNKKFKIYCYEWETADSAMIRVLIEQYNSTTQTYETLIENNWQKVYERQLKSNTANRIGIILNSDKSNDDFDIHMTAAVDDPNDVYGFNKTTSDWGERASLNANIPNRLLSVFTDNGSSSRRMSRTVRNIIYDAQIEQNMTSNSDVYFTQTLKNLPNADILSWDSDTDQGLVFTTASSTGLTADGACGTNNRDFPLFFLSLPDLPLQNFTANYGQGYENHFITPIELSLSETSQRLYTSKMYTRQYNTMSNATPLNLSRLRVRICDINGVPSKQLDKYTILVLEIRENPKIREDKHNEFIRQILDNYDKKPKLVGDQ